MYLTNELSELQDLDEVEKRLLVVISVMLTRYAGSDDVLVYLREKKLFVQVVRNALLKMSYSQLIANLDAWLKRCSYNESDQFVFRASVSFLNHKLDENEPGQDIEIYLIRRDPVEWEVSLNWDRFPVDIRDQIRTYLCQLNREVLRDQYRLMKELPIMSDEDLESIVEVFNQTEQSWGELQYKSFVALFEQRVKEMPGSIAVEYNNRVLTYAQVNEKANKLARILLKSGINKHSIVPLIMERSPEVVICILAVWKIGASYVPIDSGYPAERIKAILHDCAPEYVIVDNRLDIEPYVKNVLHIDKLIQDSLMEPTDNLHIIIKENYLAYIIYTSGTSGSPKGVMIEHCGMLNHLLAKVYDLQLSRDTSVAQTASLSFDISVWQMFAPLCVGGRTHIYSQSDQLNLMRFFEYIKRDSIQILEVVPSYLSIMVQWLSRKPNHFPALRYLLVTGEELKPNLVNNWIMLYPNIPLVNAYGPTEASDDITHHFIDKVCLEKVPIGKPIPNMKIYIVNDDMELCPIGVKGEIIVTGAGVGRGYLNNTAKTAKSFVTMKLLPSDSHERRFYRTGDIGCWTQEGSILFYGRKDNQVKLKGYRVELSDIDHTLIKCEGIRDAVTVAYYDEQSLLHLVSFVKSEFELNIINIKKQLAKLLPSYMIPEKIEAVSEFPLNANGKVDKKKMIASIHLAK